MINAGEGGFLCTDDDEIAARAICYAGCYELLYEQHVIAPPAEVFELVKFETPNYSLRMSDLTASCIRPQIDNLEERVAKVSPTHAPDRRPGFHREAAPRWTARRPARESEDGHPTPTPLAPAPAHPPPRSPPTPLTPQYNERYAAIVARLEDSPHIDVPPLDPRVRPVCDSLQFNLVGMDAEQAARSPSL